MGSPPIGNLNPSYGPQILVDPSRTACNPSSYMAADAIIIVNVWNSNASAVVTVDWYQVDPTGRMVRSQQVITPTTTRTNSSVTIPVTEGYLMGLTVKATGSSATGQTFVRVAAELGFPATVQVMQVICQGYVSNLNRLSWPNGTISTTTDGQGNMRSVTGTTPGPGADISETVPAFAIWRLIAFNYSLTTSAVAGNRTPGFLIDDGANVVLNYASIANVIASTTAAFNAVAGSNLLYTANTPIIWPVPQQMWLPAGFRIRTLTGGILAGDQYTAPHYLVEEFILG